MTAYRWVVRLPLIALVLFVEVDEVTVEGRDSDHGYGGIRVTLPLPD